MMRLFVALPLEEAVRQRLAEMSRQVAVHSLRADIPPPENAHLTFAFIGESSRAAAAAACIEALDAAPFPLMVTGIGRFRRRAEGDILWAGVRPDPPLLRLQAQVAAGLRAAGFALEARAFHPHLTLARRVTFRQREDFTKLQALFPPEDPQCEMPAARVCLMRSERAEGRQVYTEMAARRL